QRVDGRLRMHNHFYPARRKIEQPAGLDYFKSLVHQSGRVYGDALAYLLGRMVQRLLYSDFFEFGSRRVQKWTVTRGKLYALYFIDSSSAHALVHGVVFAVDREQRFAMHARFRGDEFAGGDQAFLVGQPNLFS